MRKILFLFVTMLLSSVGLHAQTTIIPHPFTVGMDGKSDEPYVIYFTAENISKDTWKESYSTDGQRLLTKDEWDYLLNSRTNNSIVASNFRGWAELVDAEGNVTAAYAVLLPDDWATVYDFDATNSAWKTKETAPQNVFIIGTTFASNSLTQAQMEDLQQAGALFLPCDITEEMGTYAHGQYWTGTQEESHGIYFVQFSTSSTTPSENTVSIVNTGEASETRYVLWAQEQVTITLDENVNNTELLSPWVTNQQPVNVALVRSLTTGMYNTICLPFNLTTEEVKTTFGNATRLAKFISATLSEDKKSLNVVFEEVSLETETSTAIEAGVPYIIQPENQVTNPTFSNRIIECTQADGESFSPSDTIAYLGIINPHQLETDNKRYLFLQANNTLTWSKEGDTSTMTGMRAYFYVPDMVDMPAQCPARLSVRPASHTPTDLGQRPKEQGQRTIKFMQNGKLFIKYNGIIYNMQGGREL